jgi:predicted PurR-regulated permease PerM
VSNPDEERARLIGLGGADPGAVERLSPPKPMLDRLAWLSGRLLLIAAGLLSTIWLLAKLRVVLFPVIAALFLSTALVPVARWLQRHGWPRLLATWAAFGGFLVVVIGTIALLVPVFVDQFADLGPTVEQGIDDVEDWLVTGPFELDRADVDRYRAEAGEQLGDYARGSGGGLVAGAVVVLEVLAAVLLALVTTFFFVKDGDAMQRWALSHVPDRHHNTAREAGRAAWATIGRYLRASATLGLLEGIIIGTTLFLVGAGLAIPVGIITFVAAFFPLVGAVTAGIIASLVALVSGGLTDAAIVGGVCLVVQQFDNDLLAPVIYGKAVQLHPLVVLLAIAAGGAVGGLAGAFLAVPVTAVCVAMAGVVRGAAITR